MVEMNETASILNNISDRSLVLLDEIEEERVRMMVSLLLGLPSFYMNILLSLKPYLLRTIMN
jgi:hypothetical protein